MKKLLHYFTTALALTISACSSQQLGTRSSVVDYLYPATNAVPAEAAPVSVLQLPIKLGIAFVPGEKQQNSGADFWQFTEATTTRLTETKKMQIMQKIAGHFSSQPYIDEIQIIPSAYLTAKGSFSNLDQIKTMYGIDVIALVSYDQVQFTDDSKLSLSYWTLVGAYIVSGQKNDTNTLMDTVVYDISSRKMLFRAPGISKVKGRSTPVNLNEELRADSIKGFELASEEMITNLDLQLDLFTQRLKQKPENIKVVSNGYGGAFSIGWLLLLLGTITAGKMLSCYDKARKVNGGNNR